jgi:hypothetical protein
LSDLGVSCWCAHSVLRQDLLRPRPSRTYRTNFGSSKSPHKKPISQRIEREEASVAYIDGEPTSRRHWSSNTRPFLWYHLFFRSVLLSSRRLWPAPTTAPLAALPPVAAPIAAPAAAPLAFSPVFFSGWACVAGGGGVDFAGCVCANAGGNIALATNITVTNAMTLNECFTWPLSGSSVPAAMRPARPTLLTMLPVVVRCIVGIITHT